MFLIHPPTFPEAQLFAVVPSPALHEKVKVGLVAPPLVRPRSTQAKPQPLTHSTVIDPSRAVTVNSKSGRVSCAPPAATHPAATKSKPMLTIVILRVMCPPMLGRMLLQ